MCGAREPLSPSRILPALVLVGSSSPGRFVLLASFCLFLFLSFLWVWSSFFCLFLCCLPPAATLLFPYSPLVLHPDFPLCFLLLDCFHLLTAFSIWAPRVFPVGQPPRRAGSEQPIPVVAQEKCGAFLASPTPLSGFCSSAAHHELLKQGRQERVVWWLEARGGSRPARLHSCLRLVLLPDPRRVAESQLPASPLPKRGMRRDLPARQLCLHTAPAPMGWCGAVFPSCPNTRGWG